MVELDDEEEKLLGGGKGCRAYGKVADENLILKGASRLEIRISEEGAAVL